MIALLNVRAEVPHSRLKDSIFWRVFFPSSREQSSGSTAKVRTGRSGTWPLFDGKKTRSTLAPQKKTFWTSALIRSSIFADGMFRSPIRQKSVQVGLHAEVITIALDREVVAGGPQGLQDGLHVADVEVGLGDVEPQTPEQSASSRVCPPLGLEEDRRSYLPVKPRFLDGATASLSMRTANGFLLSADIRRNGSLQPALPELLEGGGAKHGIIQRGCAEPEERIFVGALETLLVSPRHPERQQPKDSSRLLEPR